MSDGLGRTHQLRQWRVTITEDRDGQAYQVGLSWRTFPCSATKWDGQRWYTIPSGARLPITSLDALREVLVELAAGDWVEARYPRQ